MATLPGIVPTAQGGLASQPGGIAQPMQSLPSIENPTLSPEMRSTDSTKFSLDAIPALEPIKPPNFGMKLVGILAAAKGNFDPMFEIMNMERKTQLYQRMAQVSPQVNRMILQGEHQQAIDLWNAHITQLSAVAPEIGKMMQPMTDKVYSAQKTAQTVDALTAVIKHNIETDKFAADPTKLRDAKSFLATLHKLRNVPDEKTLATMLQMTAVKSYHPDPASRSIIATTQSGQVEQIPIPSRFTIDMLKGWTGDTLSNATGFTIPEIANIVNGEAVVREGINVTPSRQAAMTQAVTILQGVEAQRDMVKQVPVRPEENEAGLLALKRQGVPDNLANLIMAIRGTPSPQAQGIVTGQMQGQGAVSGDYRETARDIRLDEQKRQAQIALTAHLDVPIASTPNLSHIAIVNTDKSSGLWTTENRQMSFNEAKVSKEWTNMDRKIWTEKVVPLRDMLSDLKVLPDLFEEAGSPEGFIERLASGLQRVSTAAIGTSDPRKAKLEAYALLYDRALETLAGTASIPSTQMKTMKAVTMKGFASESSAIAATKVLADRTEAAIERAMNESSKSVTRTVEKNAKTSSLTAPGTPIPSSIARTVPGATPQAPPTQPQYTAVIDVISGLSNIRDPLSKSTMWPHTMIDPRSGSVSALDIAKVLASERVADAKARGLKDVDRFLVRDADSVDVVVERLTGIEKLLTDTKAAPAQPAPSILPPGVVRHKGR